MKKDDLLKNIRIDRMDNKTVFVRNNKFDFCYNKLDGLIKEEYIEKYRYFGGLQCDYNVDSIEYKNLENLLCDLAEKVLNI